MLSTLAASLLVATASFAAEKKGSSASNLSLPSDRLPIVGGEKVGVSATSEFKADGKKDPNKELREIESRIRKGDLPKVQFDFDSANIRAESYSTLDAVADLLLRYPKYKLLITAHTCDMGTADYNFRLSLRRAKSVKGYLVKRGVPPPSIRFRGKGFSEPVADNKTEEGREKNRRVEFQLLKRWWPSVY